MGVSASVVQKASLTFEDIARHLIKEYEKRAAEVVTDSERDQKLFVHLKQEFDALVKLHSSAVPDTPRDERGDSVSIPFLNSP